jgi:hypothetical protein
MKIFEPIAQLCGRTDRGAEDMTIKAPFYWLRMAATVLFLAASATPSHAESYSSLESQGYTTSKMMRGASGNLGWAVAKGGKKYFCKMRAARAYVGTKGMVAFTSAGRQIELDRQVYEGSVGFDSSIPQLSDLKAGKLTAANVGNCAPAK